MKRFYCCVLHIITDIKAGKSQPIFQRTKIGYGTQGGCTEPTAGTLFSVDLDTCLEIGHENDKYNRPI